jgi:hypothetical protein
MTKLISEFNAATLTDYPVITAYESERLKVLWVLWIAKEKFDTPWVSPGAVEEVLRDVFGVLVPRQRIPSLISGQATARRKVQGRFCYQLMQAGQKELQQVPETVTFIDPSQALSRIREIEGLLREKKGTISVCDPYADGRTLDFLAECSAAAEIRLLTQKINKLGPFQRDLGAFRQQHPKLPIEVRIPPQAVLHDRYLIDESTMNIFGTSLNSLGRKQSFVIAAGDDVRRIVLAEFDQVWLSSSVVT